MQGETVSGVADMCAQGLHTRCAWATLAAGRRSSWGRRSSASMWPAVRHARSCRGKPLSPHQPISVCTPCALPPAAARWPRQVASAVHTRCVSLLSLACAAATPEQLSCAVCRSAQSEVQMESRPLALLGGLLLALAASASAAGILGILSTSLAAACSLYAEIPPPRRRRRLYLPPRPSHCMQPRLRLQTAGEAPRPRNTSH